MLDQHLKQVEEAIEKEDWIKALEYARQLGNYIITLPFPKMTKSTLSRIGKVMAQIAQYNQGVSK